MSPSFLPLPSLDRSRRHYSTRPTTVDRLYRGGGKRSCVKFCRAAVPPPLALNKRNLLASSAVAATRAVLRSIAREFAAEERLINFGETSATNKHFRFVGAHLFKDLSSSYRVTSWFGKRRHLLSTFTGVLQRSALRTLRRLLRRR